jgi:hypothetical protein
LSATVQKSEQRWALKWAIIVVGLACLPYLVAWRLAPAGSQYTGLLANPLDGETYYAKMLQGARGDWLFHLAFTPESHDGAFVYTLYLGLGHISALTGLSIPLTYHLARVAAGIFLLLVAYRFVAHFFAGVSGRRLAFFLLAFSSGLGWLFAPFGVTTTDLWVAEGFTFLSIFTNPHFPLAIGLMLLIFLLVLETPLPGQPRAGSPNEAKQSILPRLLAATALGLLLAVVQPFPVPSLLAVLGVYLALLAWHEHTWPLRSMLVAGAAALGAAPILIYDLYVYRTNPALAAWSAQNVTLSPPPWEYAVGYGLVLLLALGGLGITVRRRDPPDLFLLAWVSSTAVLLYVPFALQRRFITGFHVPLVVLAAICLEQIVRPRIAPRRRAMVTGLLVGLTAITNLFVPVVTVAGAAQGGPPLVISNDEAAACTWLRAHTVWTDTVLAPADVGQFIPAWAGNRVVYGHPFETIDAATREAEVLGFYGATATTEERRALLERYDVRYVLVPGGTGVDTAELALTPVWSSDNIVLYDAGVTP